ncbi:MAG: TatD family hydrolase [Flavobacteriaceae bacterium]|nr:TatD family hydrolase [Flavobacteriaceae bacterium]
MGIVDTHIHLYSEAFDDDRSDLIEKAKAEGVSHFFLPAIDSTYTDRMKALQKAYPQEVFLMSGLHPTHVNENYKSELDHVYKELTQSSEDYVAVGEIGIDLYWDKTFVKEQTLSFETQINWALSFDLPIVIHCRAAFDEIFEVLESYRSKPLYGIFHCFSGSSAQAQKAIDLGFKLGIGGVVTFKNGKIDQFLNQLDLGSLVLETDAPYLAPSPYRGKRNIPSYINLVADKVAELYNIPREEVIEKTAATALALFRKSN